MFLQPEILDYWPHYWSHGKKIIFQWIEAALYEAFAKSKLHLGDIFNLTPFNLILECMDIYVFVFVVVLDKT